MEEHLYIVMYDISDPKRWRSVFKFMHSYGEWLQLSVFQCRLSRRRCAEMVATLDELILDDHDHVVMVDVGPAEKVEPKVISLGKAFRPIEREPVIV